MISDLCSRLASGNESSLLFALAQSLKIFKISRSCYTPRKCRKLCPGHFGDWRALRGGSWHNQVMNNNDNNVRSSYRNDNQPNNRNNNNGFRLVRLVAHLIDL